VKQEYRPRRLRVPRRWKNWRNYTSSQPRFVIDAGELWFCQDVRSVHGWAGRTLRIGVARYAVQACKSECRRLLDLLGVETGRISGSLARDCGVAAVGRILGRRVWRIVLGREDQVRWHLEVSSDWDSSCELQ